MIEIGQNAKGEWAWIVRADRHIIASGEGLRFREAAVLIAENVEAAYRAMRDIKAIAGPWIIDPTIGENETGQEPEGPAPHL